MEHHALRYGRFVKGLRGMVAGVAAGALLATVACMPAAAAESGAAITRESRETNDVARTYDAYGASNGADGGTRNGTDGAGTVNGSPSATQGTVGTPSDGVEGSGAAGDDANAMNGVADGTTSSGDSSDARQSPQSPSNGTGTEPDVAAQSDDQTAAQDAQAEQDQTADDANLSEIDKLAAANRNVVAEGGYTIVSALGSDLVLDVSAGSGRNGANVQIYKDNASAAQRWSVTKDAKGYLTITNEKSGKPLDVAGGNATPGANVQQYAANGTAAQKWIAVPNADGTVTLRSALDGRTALALDVSGAAARSGANVQIYSANGTAAQNWRFEALPKVSEPILSYWNAHLSIGRPTGEAVAAADGVRQQFRGGVVFHHASANTTVIVRDVILTKYDALGGERGALGYPVAEAGTDASKRGREQRFEHGVIVWSQTDGAVAMTDRTVIDYWNANKAGAGWLGFPKGDTVTAGASATQTFDGGTVINDPDHTAVPSIWARWSSGPSDATTGAGASGAAVFGDPGDGIIVQYPNGVYFKQFPNGIIFTKSATDASAAMDITGDMYAYWRKHDLGVPSGGRVQGARLGYWQEFAGGRVYWSPNGGVHLVRAAVLAKYAALGYDAGALGYPTSDENTLRNGGVSQVFEHGQIHWTAKTGAHATQGDILDYWKSRNWENGWLGYPTGDELTGLKDGGISQTFQGGTVFWSPKTGAHGVTGGILGDYAARGYEGGNLGYPTNEEHDWGQGRAQDFQHGTLYWRGCGKRGWQNPGGYFQVSSCNVSVPNNGRFGFFTPTRIGMSATRQQSIDAMINRAYEYLGTRYVWDYALQPGVGVDCAGLVMQSLYAGGLQISGDYNPSNHWYDPWHSHDANNMFNDGRFKHVPLDQRQRGDLISWPGHIAIYLGNDQIIEANVPVVKFNSLWAYGTPRGVLRPFV